MLCAVHNKEMRQYRGNWTCPTPLTKSADGSKVLEWCKWQPGEAATETIPQDTKKTDSFYTCNAMNNAVALVTAGIIPIKQLHPTYRKILSILEGNVTTKEDLDDWPEATVL